MKRIKKINNIGENHKLLAISFFPILAIFISLVFGHKVLLEEYLKILKHPGLLITDYTYVGGFYGTLFNISLVALLNLIIIYYFKIPLNGLVFAGFFTGIGFSAFGKTILNILPIYLGGYIYAKKEKVDYRNIFGILMFAAGIAPLISFILFNPSLNIYQKILGGLGGGLLIGFIMPALPPHMLKIHEGHNLYNVGFTLGMFGILLASFMRGKGLELTFYYKVSTEYDFYFKLILTISFLFYILLGYLLNNKSLESFDSLISSSGRLLSDFIITEGFGISLINAGILGLASLGLVTFLEVPINGPLFAGIFTVFGFGALGKTPLNCAPVIIGVLFGSLIKEGEFNNFNIALTALFSTTLAPISGVYGPLYGVIAGVLHLFVVNNTSFIHGGMNLYNNGFSGGLIASIMVPIIQKFNLGEKYENKY